MPGRCATDVNLNEASDCVNGNDVTKGTRAAASCGDVDDVSRALPLLAPVISSLPPLFSLYPRRAIKSATADFFSSFPQKESVTGMLKAFCVPWCTTLEWQIHSMACAQSQPGRFVEQKMTVKRTGPLSYPSTLARLRSMT